MEVYERIIIGESGHLVAEHEEDVVSSGTGTLPSLPDDPCLDGLSSARSTASASIQEGTNTSSTSAVSTAPSRPASLGWPKQGRELPEALEREGQVDPFIALSQALKGFLHSPEVAERLGDDTTLEELKELLCSPAALRTLQGEAARAKSLHCGDQTVAEECLSEFLRTKVGLPHDCAESPSYSRKGGAHEVSCFHTLFRSNTICRTGPHSDVLLPLSQDGVPIEDGYRQIALPVWTLQSLVSPTLIRRQEYCDEAEAWEMFHVNAATPCILRDPQGTEVASRAWITEGRVSGAQEAWSFSHSKLSSLRCSSSSLSLQACSSLLQVQALQA
jgi:hypothetical protein